MSRGLSLTDMMRLKIMKTELEQSQARFGFEQEQWQHTQKMGALAQARSQSELERARLLTLQESIQARQKAGSSVAGEAGKEVESIDLLEDFYEQAGIPSSEREKRRQIDMAQIDQSRLLMQEEIEKTSRAASMLEATRARENAQAQLEQFAQLARTPEGRNRLQHLSGFDDEALQALGFDRRLLDAALAGGPEPVRAGAQSEFMKQVERQYAETLGQLGSLEAKLQSSGKLNKAEQKTYNEMQEQRRYYEGLLGGAGVETTPSAPREAGVVQAEPAPIASGVIATNERLEREIDFSAVPKGTPWASVRKDIEQFAAQRNIRITPAQWKALEKRYTNTNRDRAKERRDLQRTLDEVPAGLRGFIRTN